jgi:hypothetical protein
MLSVTTMGESTSPHEQELVVVATAGSEPEAEVLLQLLRSAGIVALTQRTLGAVEWGASGSRYIYARAEDAARAHELLAGYASSGDDG